MLVRATRRGSLTKARERRSSLSRPTSAGLPAGRGGHTRVNKAFQQDLPPAASLLFPEQIASTLREARTGDGGMWGRVMPREMPRGRVHLKAARDGEMYNIAYEGVVLDLCAHPNVIRCYGLSEDGQSLILEEGVSDLYEHIASSEECRLSAEEVSQIAHSIADALASIHGKGFAHNDIKLENIVLCDGQDGEGRIPKIIDFEFASHADAPPPEGHDKIVGTPAYDSPEKSEHTLDFDRQASDMWSLGVALHLATYGHFPNGTAEALPILGANFKAPEGTDAVVAALLENLLKINAAERWSAQQVMDFLSGEEMAVEVEDWMGGLDECASPPSLTGSVSCPDLSAMSSTFLDALKAEETKPFVLNMEPRTILSKTSAYSTSPLPSPLRAAAAELHLTKPPNKP